MCRHRCVGSAISRVLCALLCTKWSPRWSSGGRSPALEIEDDVAALLRRRDHLSRAFPCGGVFGSAMAAVWIHARAELCARWRAMLGLALLVGGVGGAAIAAAAGARRTDSAYPRFLTKYGFFQASVSTGGNPQTDQIFDEIAHLPQVVATSRSSLFSGTLTA